MCNQLVKGNKMDLQLAKSRRLEALKKTSADRLLVAPAKHVSELRLPKEGSIAAHMIKILREGFTIEEFAAEMEWSKSRIMVNLYQVAKKTGVGIQRRSQLLQLVMPEGASDISPRQIEAQAEYCNA